MVRAINRFSDILVRCLLKSAGAVVTFLLTFYLYASGQIVRPAVRSDREHAPSFFGALLGAVALSAERIAPEYGVAPLYGVVDYGMPYATFAVKGTIRQMENDKPIKGIRVMIKDTADGTVLVDDTTTDAGAYSLEWTTARMPIPTSWILHAADVDGMLNGGVFDSKDTLVTIPLDSLKGGSGFYLGRAEAAVSMLLDGRITSRDNSASDRRPESSFFFFAQQSANVAGVCFENPHLCRVHLSVYDARGRKAADLFDAELAAGLHALRFDVSRFPPGRYFFRLDANGTSRMLEATLRP